MKYCGENFNEDIDFKYIHNAVRFDVALANETNFKVGGHANIFFEPVSTKQLTCGLEFFEKHNIPISIIGGGSNLLISDSGVEGVVLRLNNLKAIHSYEKDGHIFVEAGAGISTNEVSKFCAENGIAGFETFAGLPGYIGGATFMNARCYDVSISDIFYFADTVKLCDSKIISDKHSFISDEWSYKISPFQHAPYGIAVSDGREIIASVTFKLRKGNTKTLLEERRKYIQNRVEKGHFKKPSAGSTFKNNRDFGKPSGQIIDELGLKGLSYNGAQVAPWHGNFIINNDNASASDIRYLIEEVARRVFEKTGFRLEPEVIFAGSW